MFQVKKGGQYAPLILPFRSLRLFHRHPAIQPSGPQQDIPGWPPHRLPQSSHEGSPLSAITQFDGLIFTFDDGR